VDLLSVPHVITELNCCCRCRVETLSCVEPEEVQYTDFVEEGQRLARELRVSIDAGHPAWLLTLQPVRAATTLPCFLLRVFYIHPKRGSGWRSSCG
jgi:hypothetical protein